MDIYVGVDPGSKNCAMVAWSPTRGLITTWKPKGTMPTGVLRLRRLMVSISDELQKLECQGRICKIAMEGYSMFEKFGQHASGEVGAAIKLTILGCFDAQDPRAYPLIVQPQTLKKFVSGSGNTRKDMIPKEILKRWAMDFNDPNIAEAYALARVAHAFDVEPEMPKFQQEVIKGLAGHTEYDPTFTTRRLVRVGR